VGQSIVEIAAYIRRFAAAPPDQVAAFIRGGKPRRLAAGEDFCALGQEFHELAFIHGGIVRYYVILPNGEDATKDFSFSNSFTMSFGNAVMNQAAEVAIAAVTECAFTVWPYRALTDLFERHAEWQSLGRRVAEMLYVRKERRELSFLLEDAEQRYRAMVSLFPEQLDEIPQYFLASYLGIRPQSLSRLKKKLGASPR
jgi:CRP-like cAMP-binding protein